MKKSSNWIVGFVATVLLFSNINPANSAASLLNKSCTKINATAISAGKKLICVTKSGKKVWALKPITIPTPTPTPAPAPTTSVTISQSNAVMKAQSYLRYSSFSRIGLIKQLEFEGFSNADAIYGVDKQNTNWNDQAILKAKSYLRVSSYSRSGLIKQLEFEGFTNEQAVFGVNATGL